MGMEKLKPVPADLFTDEDLSSLDPVVKVTAFGLHQHADDSGRESTTLWRLKAAIWPSRPQVTEAMLVDHLLVLDDVGYIGIYTVGDRTYYQRRVFPAPSHPRPSKHPAPPLDLFQRFAGRDPDDRSAWEREQASDERSESPVHRPAGVPPSPFCKLHRPAGSGGVPCIHCKDAYAHHQQVLYEMRASLEQQE